MLDQAAILFQALAWFARGIGTSESLFQNFETGSLGLDLPDSVLTVPAVEAARQRLLAGATGCNAAAEALETAADTGNEQSVIQGLLQVTDGLGRFFTGITPMQTALQVAITPATLPDAAARTEAQAFANVFADRLSSYIAASTITDTQPVVAFYLTLLGLMDWRIREQTVNGVLSVRSVEKALRLNRVKDLFSDPLTHFQTVHGWGAPSFDPQHLFDLFAGFFAEEDDVTSTRIAGDAVLRWLNFELARDSTVSPPGLSLSYLPTFSAEGTGRQDITDQWGASVMGSLNASGQLTGTLRPPFAVSIRPPSGEMRGEAKLFFDRNEQARPFSLLDAGPIKLQANNISLGFGLDAAWQSATGNANIEPKLFADIQALTLALGGGDQDSFISELLQNAEIEGVFDLGLLWKPSSGLKIRASGGIEIAIPVQRSLGPITLDKMFLALRILQDATLQLETSAGLTGRLGPLTATVERLGLLTNFRFSDGASAALGPFDLSFAFKPPSGVGLSIDAGVVRGGGYLYIDAERGEYAGVLELTFASFLSLKAIGIITTRLPDGSDGFSLLAIITAEFGPSGFQLGFGFKLMGVGGLLGLNRSVNLEALVAGVRSGSVNNIMFPQNVVANAPRIISDLRAIFPQRQGTFLIGPMAKIGWGTPTLVSLSLGVIIEIPGNIAILGVLRVNLPGEELPVLQLQVSFVGAIEPDRKRVYFFASLFDSRVLFITLDGDMGLLAAFGEDANFVLSVGGFHPRFQPPPLPFPVPTRITACILNESWGRIRAECYFAVTTNTVQFGSRVEIFFGFDVLSVESTVTFDALFQFSPFSFVIEMSSNFSVRVFGVGVWGLSIQLMLEGPTPWHARGRACISLLFFDIPVEIDETWGERRGEIEPPIAMLGQIAQELEKAENWRAFNPTGRADLVTLRKFDEASQELLLHPAGSLRVMQKLVPLNVPITKVGNRKVSDGRSFRIVAAPGAVTQKAVVKERFARAQYNVLSDAERLSSPAFEPFDAGLDLAPAGLAAYSSDAVKRTNRYELITIDTAGARKKSRFHTLAVGITNRFLAGAAVSASTLSARSLKQQNPFNTTVATKAEGFVVAYIDSNVSLTNAPVFESEAGAQNFLATQLGSNPALAGRIQVLPEFELAA